MATAGAAAEEPRTDLRNYTLVTGAYWTDTLVDGASRMLVLFYFYQLGYSPFQLASLFVLYEFFGIVTNLVGGWVAARFGLKTTLFMGLSVRSAPRACSRFAPEAVARRALRNGFAGAVRHREGPDEDELQERRQAGRARRPGGRCSTSGSRS